MAEGKVEIWADLEASTWRGIPWFIETITVDGGRKVTPKPIINSSNQVVDDVGLKQRVYKVRGYITAQYATDGQRAQSTLDDIAAQQDARRERERSVNGSTPALETDTLSTGSTQGNIGKDYRERRKELTAAFEAEGKASLIHPIEGTITDLFCQEFSIDENMTEVGIGRVSATFIRQTTTPIPEPLPGAKEEVNNLADVADAAADAQINEQWAITKFLVNAYEFSVEKLSGVYAIGLVVAESVETVTDAMDQFQRDIAEAEAAVFAVVDTAVGVVDSIQGVFSSISGLFGIPGAAFQALQNGFSFGDFDIDFDFSTPSGKQKKANQRALNASIQCRFLTEAYRVGLDLDYVTTDDVALVEEILEAQHRKIVDGTDADDCVKDALTALRESFFDFLGDAKLQARSLVEEDVTTTTPRVLAYMLYENDDDTETLAGLNGVVAYETISGAVTVLSE